MKTLALKSYERLHAALVKGVRLLPVSSRTFGPPKGLIPDMRQWIDDYKGAHPREECWYRKIHDAGNIQRRPARTLDETPAGFQEERRVELPESFVASIPQARLLSHSGIIIAPDDRVFEESCCWKSFFFTRDIEYNTLRRRLKSIKLEGSYLMLISRHANNYYHWFTECLSRLCIGESLPKAPILVQDGLREWQRESLALLGIASDRLVQLPMGCYEVDQLYFPSFSGYATFTTDWSFTWADWTLLKLREKFCGKRTLEKDKRIYISRAGVAHRQVLNEDSVIRSLEREGFLIVNPTSFTVEEKIRLFGDAGLIVGAHGAGLIHQLFAPAGARLVEAVDPFHLGGVFSYQVGSALGQEYWYLFAENHARKSAKPVKDVQLDRYWPFKTADTGLNGSRKGYDDLIVPVDLLLRTIEAAETSLRAH